MTSRITKTNKKKQLSRLIALPIVIFCIYSISIFTISNAIENNISTSPTINQITNNDRSITGTGIANSTITLKDANGAAITCNSTTFVDSSGKYTCDLNTPLITNTIVLARAAESGKDLSNPVSSVVTTAIGAQNTSYTPLTINGGKVQFNIPDSLKNSQTASYFNANFDPAIIGDWKLTQGPVLDGLSGMTSLLVQKDPNNVISLLISNQSPEITNQTTTRVVLDQAALDAASGIASFKPVEIGGPSNLVRIPNISTPASGDWWYIPKANVETSSYTVQTSDFTNANTSEALNAFYKSNVNAQIVPEVGDNLAYSFILQGNPSAFSPASNLSISGSVNTPENLIFMDNIVRTSSFDNSNTKLQLPKVKSQKTNQPTISSKEESRFDWAWLTWLALPLLLLLSWLYTKKQSSFNSKSKIEDQFKSQYLPPKDNSNIIKTEPLKEMEIEGIKESYKEELKIENPTIVTPVKEYKHEVITSALNQGPISDEVQLDDSEEVIPQTTNHDTTNTPDYKYPNQQKEDLIESKNTYQDKPSNENKTTVIASNIEQNSSISVETPKERIDNNLHNEIAIKQDNFQVIEGIGPVIEKYLKQGGINSYEDLSNTTIPEIEHILSPIGKDLSQSHTNSYTSSWAEQAKLAKEEKWDALNSLKTILIKGTSINNTNNQQNNIELNKNAPTSNSEKPNSDDLKKIEGIGPVTERNLNAAGIYTYQAITKLSEQEIEKILVPNRNSYTVFNCSTWSEQANLADQGKWDDLKKLQDIIDKGVKRN